MMWKRGGFNRKKREGREASPLSWSREKQRITLEEVWSLARLTIHRGGWADTTNRFRKGGGGGVRSGGPRDLREYVM